MWKLARSQLKPIVVIAVFCFAVFDSAKVPAEALAEVCYITYYQTKSGACLDSMLEQIKAIPIPPIKGGNSDSLIGFFAQLFSTDLEEKNRIIAKDLGPGIRSIFVAALYRADQSQDAIELAEKIGQNDFLIHYKADFPSILKTAQPTNYPGENDFLIGAYKASGDMKYIKSILNNYTSADDQMASDAMRMGLMQAKFGGELKAMGRESVMLPVACDRYNCKANPQQFLRVVTLLTALWAVRSLSEKDMGVKQAYQNFFESDARLQKIHLVEINNFTNYITGLITYVALKNDPKLNPALNATLLTYEKFGTAKEIFDASGAK